MVNTRGVGRLTSIEPSKFLVDTLPLKVIWNTVLVICNCATRYAEAMALKSIEGEVIDEKLIRLFSRVGVPKEILIDQGSNFTLQLLKEVYCMLKVHPIQTSPYHRQTDGLFERFNQTLVGMPKKFAKQDPKN